MKDFPIFHNEVKPEYCVFLAIFNFYCEFMSVEKIDYSEIFIID
jgi:hypothetical protein